ncbi:hypothetical protein Q7P37_000525 [Cladosporium fusiforme]
MDDPLDHRFLRTGDAKDIALHLRRLASDNPQSLDALSQQLLQAISSESVPPMIYALWTSACPDESAVAAGLRQSDSVIIRSSAIRTFRRRLRTSTCDQLWRALGGTEGIVALLAEFSVIHVKEFCKAVSRCSTGKLARDARRLLVTELLQALMPGPRNQNPDKRPLLYLYSKLVPTCTTEAQDLWTARSDLPRLEMAELFQTDTSWYQAKCLRALSACGDNLGEELKDFLPLFTSIPQERSASDPSVSASMSFTVQILESLQRHSTVPQDTHWLEETLCSLLLRIVRRKPSRTFTVRALSCIVYCTEKRSGEAPKGISRRSYKPNDRWFLDIIRLWQRDPSAYEPLLTPLMFLDSIETCVLTAKYEQRYRLMKWMLANHARYRVDIEDGAQLTRKFSLSLDLMLSLPRVQARGLLERYQKHAPGELGMKRGILRRLEDQDHDPCGRLLHLYLMVWSDEAQTEATSQNLQSRKMAEQSGAQPIRAAWLVASVYFAVASKSLPLLKDTLIWARRFSSDPKTVVELYSGAALCDPRALDLLCGVPAKRSELGTIANIKDNICQSNEIILLLLESAILSQSEPSFSPNNWFGIKTFIREVICLRFRRSPLLQSLDATDDLIYSSVFENTLEMLLRAEHLSLDEHNKALEFWSFQGFLKSRWYYEGLPLHSPSVPGLRFVEELARRREEIWVHHRPTLHPAVAALEPPWPRGLPVQALSCLHKETRLPKGSLPFLEERAEAVVFLRAEHALSPIPEDGKIQAAIGPFVDDYTQALRMYLSWCNENERQQRIQLAWNHAINVLSGDRLSKLESKQYWKRTFTDAGAPPTDSMLNYPTQTEPKLPNVNAESSDPIEWNPSSEQCWAEVKKRELKPFIIDCFTSSKIREDPMPFVTPRVSLEPFRLPGFWDLARYKPNKSRMLVETREAFIAAALSLVDGRAQAGSRVLSEPFPSVDTQRFPALCLDAELLDNESPDDEDVRNMLNHFLPAIPVSLLQRLAESMIVRFREGKGSLNLLRPWTCVVLESLIRSDKPQLAMDLAVRVIFDQPGESSWHRALIHEGIFNRLSSDQVRTTMASLVDGIVERLACAQAGDMDDATTNAHEVPGPFSPSKSTVKVTTIKMLVQLMNEATFVDQDFVVGTLVSLFSKCTHIHIRAAIVESLAGVVSNPSHEKTKETAINALVDFVVPAAAELSERSPMSEDRWREAERSCKPPEVYQAYYSTPICDALVRMVETTTLSPGGPGDLFERIFLTLMTKSRENNSRWTSIFLHKHGMAHLESEVPKPPARIKLSKLLLEKQTCRMPVVEFQNFSDLILMSYRQSQQLVDFVATLKNDPKTSKSNDAVHWIGMCEGTRTLTSINVANILKTADFTPSTQPSGIPLVAAAHLQRHEQRIIGALLGNYPSSASEWDRFIETYTPPLLSESEKVKFQWCEYARPVLRYALEKLESLRTEAWQNDQQRHPSVLPDTFELHLWLLTYPNLPLLPAHGERLERFATEVVGIIKQLAQSGRPYHTRWDLLRKAVKQCDPHDWATLALRLGTVDVSAESRPLTLEILLRVELADVLVLGVSKTQSKGKSQAVLKMLERWAESRDEDLRRKGIGTLGKLAKAGWVDSETC